jgi:predicted RND superfamily exporter protein
MARIRGFLLMVIVLALAVHLVWDALAPLIPYVIGVLIALAVLGALYYRKR